MTELLVVVAAILILVSLIVVGTNMTYGRAVRLKCQNRLEQIGHACLMYASENQGVYPPVWNFATQSRWYETLAATHLPNPEYIACPLEPTPPITYQSVEFTESDSVMEGLRWLAENQEEDGYWAVEKWGGRGGTRGEGYHTGTTALALMAFLFFGCTDQYPAEYAGTVGSAIEWLLSRQRTSGRFRGYDYGTWYLYDHATATMAMALAYIKTGRQDCAASALGGLQHLADMQAPGGSYGWGYTINMNDVSITGWAIQAIDMGQKAGLAGVGGGGAMFCQDRMHGLLRNLVHSSDYRSTYRFGPQWDRDETGHRRYAATAISLLTRLLMGHRPASTANHTTNSGRARGVLNRLHGSNNYFTYASNLSSRRSLYYYYYMTLANSILGGDAWDDWEENVWPEELTDLQDKDGSWDESICIWGSGYGGRAYTTALALLSLEAAMPGHWEPTTPYGECSYGYNAVLGRTREAPGADTIVVMDYHGWVIQRHLEDQDGLPDGQEADSDVNIALRHGGRANVLFGDGRVEALRLDDFQPWMWTLRSRD